MPLPIPSLLQLSSHFRSWLQSQSFSSSTVRNYLVDVNKYLGQTNQSQVFSTTNLQQYLTTISSTNNYQRQLSSLNQFFRFALDQHLTTKNPLKSALVTPKPGLSEIIKMYQSYLVQKKKHPTTIKNYINDICQYLEFTTNRSEPR